MSKFFFCHYVFKKPFAEEASESIYMRERVKGFQYFVKVFLKLSDEDLLLRGKERVFAKQQQQRHKCFQQGHNTNLFFIPLPHIDAFWRLCSRRLMKTLAKGEIAQTMFSNLLKIHTCICRGYSYVFMICFESSLLQMCCTWEKINRIKSITPFTPGNPKLDSMKVSFCTVINSSSLFPSTYRKSVMVFKTGLCFLRHLVTTALITWFGPHLHKFPLPRIPVLPRGFL